MAVLRRLDSPRSLDEIGLELAISTSTVTSHVRALYQKLGVSSRRPAVSQARRHGQLSPGSS